MNRRRQAIQFCLDSAVAVVVRIVKEFLLEDEKPLTFPAARVY